MISAMRRLAITLAATLALACEPPPELSEAKSEPSPASTSTPGPAINEGCAREPIHAELRRYCEFDLGVPPIELPKVSWTAASYHPLVSRIITVHNSGLIDPEGTGSVSIAEWLAAPPRRIPEPGELVLAIAADVPAATVAELWRGLAAAGRQQIRVLVHVRDPQGVPQPHNAQMLADMEAALPEAHNERVMFVAKGVRGYAATCPSLAAVFGQLGSVPMEDRCTHLAELAAAALVECGCLELPDIMTLLYALTIGFEPPLGRTAAVDIRLDPTQAVRVSPGATWGQVVVGTLTDATQRGLWLEP